MEKEKTTNSIAHLEVHADYLFSYVMLKLRDKALAEDMVQDTLVLAVAASNEYTAQASVRTWLTTILKNRMIDYWRKQGREIAVSDVMRFAVASQAFPESSETFELQSIVSDTESTRGLAHGVDQADWAADVNNGIGRYAVQQHRHVQPGWRWRLAEIKPAMIGKMPPQVFDKGHLVWCAASVVQLEIHAARRQLLRHRFDRRDADAASNQ